jgi:membrane-bound metal-dependent hydrolase YbcI (DUF457 family)
MKLRTHISAGILAASFSLNILELASVSPLIIFGSLIPDVDMFADHRKTFLHWYPTWAVISAAGFLFSNGLMIFGLAGLLHVFCDSFTKMGVPSLFWTRMIGWRMIRTGGEAEFYIFCGILFIVTLVQFFRMGGTCLIRF